MYLFCNRLWQILHLWAFILHTSWLPHAGAWRTESGLSRGIWLTWSDCLLDYLSLNSTLCSTAWSGFFFCAIPIAHLSLIHLSQLLLVLRTAILMHKIKWWGTFVKSLNLICVACELWSCFNLTCFRHIHHHSKVQKKSAIYMLIWLYL